MADMVTRQELEAAKVDVKHAGEAVNSKKVITPRYGQPFNSFPLELENLGKAINFALTAGAGAAGWLASLVADESGMNQQQINNILTDPFSKDGVTGDGQFRPITDLWTIATTSYRFTTRAAAEDYLGFNPSVELIDVGIRSSVDTAYLQKYIIDCYKKFIATGVPTTIKLKDSATYIITGCQHYPGVNLISEGQTEFKKRPALDVTDESILKWWRVIVSKASAFATEAATKHRCIIDGIKLNGNMLNMNWAYNTYNQEQASLLLLQCANGSAANIRAKYELRNLVFVDSVSDGLHAVQNVDIIYSNLQAQNCFRGGLVVTGGNSIVYGDGMVSNNARADTEIDTAGFGSSEYTYLNVKNYFQDIGGKNGDFVGGCDLGGVDGSEFYFENFNCHTAPTNILTGDGARKAKSFEFKGGSLTFGNGSSAANRIFNPIGMLFDRTKLRFLDNGFISIFTYFNNYIADKDYVFNECTAEFLGTTLPLQIFRIESQPSGSLGNLIINGGDYSALPAARVVTHALGGRTVFNNVKHAATSVMLQRTHTTGYPSIVEYKKIHPDAVSADLYGVASALTAESETIFSNEMAIDVSKYKNAIRDAGTLLNRKTVYSSVAPTATTRSFIGDRFVLNVPEVGKPYEWIATTTSNTASAYRATKWLVGSFTTATLPVLTAFDVGVQNIDTTLNKLVTWTGSAWI